MESLRTFKTCKGFTLVEIILAMALFAMVFVFVFGGQWSLADLIMNNMKSVYVQYAAESTLESLFLEKNQGVISMAVYSYEETERGGLFGIMYSIVGKPFSRCSNTYEYLAHWKTGWGTEQRFSAQFLSKDFFLMDSFGFDCGGESENLLDTNLHEEIVPTSSLSTAVDMFDQYIFVSGTLAGGIEQIDSENTLDRIYVPTPAGVNKIDVTQDSIFVALQSSTTQVAIFQNENDHQLLATTTLPGVAGSRPEAVSIFYADARLYVGTKRTAGHEFHIFDVSNPESPQWLGSREINHNINDIFVKDGYAFLATSGNIRDMIVLDVSDPAHPVQTLALDLLGNEDGRSIDISYNYILLGRYKSPVPDRNELYLLRYVFDQQSRDLTTEIVSSAKAGGDVVGVRFFQNQICAVTNNASKEIEVFKLDQGLRLQPLFDRNLAASATGLDLENGKLIVSAGNEVHIFESNE